jgi:hypothetical protein
MKFVCLYVQKCTKFEISLLTTFSPRGLTADFHNWTGPEQWPATGGVMGLPLPGSRHIAHSACECILPAVRVRMASDLLLPWLGWVGEVHSVRKSVFDPCACG